MAQALTYKSSGNGVTQQSLSFDIMAFWPAVTNTGTMTPLETSQVPVADIADLSGWYLQLTLQASSILQDAQILVEVAGITFAATLDASDLFGATYRLVVGQGPVAQRLSGWVETKNDWQPTVRMPMIVGNNQPTSGYVLLTPAVDVLGTARLDFVRLQGWYVG
jgi:hypothetical protein